MLRTLNPLVEGSSPSRPTNEIKGLGPLGLEYRPTGAESGVGTGPFTFDQALDLLGPFLRQAVPAGATGG